ncbi:MAG: DNA repair protein RadC [Puniceicoccales bacterium]|jgi:DNA repair protein RadC|nr:DNA repair protein RadC [Puniceicoccales bacterium]
MSHLPTNADNTSDAIGKGAAGSIPVVKTVPLRETPVHERPQERLEKSGARVLKDEDLLAMLLRTGTQGENVMSVAKRLVHDAGSLLELVNWTRDDFAERRGIGRIKALQLETVFEIARRVREQRKEAAPLLETPQEVFNFFQDIIQGLIVEKCWVLCLDKKLRLIRCVEVSSGTADSALIHPREVFQPALRHGATRVILTHNHPSGDPEPSRADIASTRQMRDAAKVLGMELVDHIVLGLPQHDRCGQGWFSFRTAGIL